MKRLAALLVLAFPILAPANEIVIPLWPEGVPPAIRPDVPASSANMPAEASDDGGRVSHISQPRLEVVPPAIDRANGTAVIICPGGGYSRLSLEREGRQYARWCSTLGITSFVLINRVGDYGHPAPLQDVLRAIRLVRSRAAEFHLNPNRIGVIGSSAGGHLAASAGTLFAHPAGRTGAALDTVEARPDFMMLLYPVISMDDPVAHVGSRQQLLGPKPTNEELALMSLEKQVTTSTPPTILFHTQDDKVVPVENSILFYQALTRAHVPAELHIFEHGPHGMGMRNGLGTASEWPHRAEEWLRARGLLEQAPPTK